MPAKYSLTQIALCLPTTIPAGLPPGVGTLYTRHLVGLGIKAADPVGAGRADAVEIALHEPEPTGLIEVDLLDVVVRVLQAGEGLEPLGDDPGGPVAVAVQREPADAGGQRLGEGGVLAQLGEPDGIVLADLDEGRRSAGGDGELGDAPAPEVEPANGGFAGVAEPNRAVAYLHRVGLAACRQREALGGAVRVLPDQGARVGLGVPDVAGVIDVDTLGERGGPGGRVLGDRRGARFDPCPHARGLARGRCRSRGGPRCRVNARRLIVSTCLKLLCDGLGDAWPKPHT